MNAAGAETFGADEFLPASLCPSREARVLVPDLESESAPRVPSPRVRVPSLGRARRARRRSGAERATRERAQLPREIRGILRYECASCRPIATATATATTAHTRAEGHAAALHRAANAPAHAPVSWGTMPTTHIGAMITRTGTRSWRRRARGARWNDAPTVVSARCVAGAISSTRTRARSRRCTGAEPEFERGATDDGRER